MAEMEVVWDEDGLGLAAISWPDVRFWLKVPEASAGAESVRLIDGDGRELRIPDDATLIAGFRRGTSGFEPSEEGR